jgi:tripartite-type tricarboxylate transporter receptor subunit TctC
MKGKADREQGSGRRRCSAVLLPSARASAPCCLLLAAALVMPPATYAAENYPARPIRVVVPTGAGGITDILARMVGQQLGERLGQQVVIDNRPGASGILGTQLVATATPDGYTLLMVYPAHPVNPSLVAKLPYDTVKDFVPITMVSAVSLLLVVNAALPVKSVQDLIALAKQRPGQINYGAVGTGSLGHLGSELFKFLSGADFTHIAYKGAPQVFTALLSGEISVYFVATVSSALPHLNAGKLRALGVSTNQRSPLLPDVPPISDTVPGYEVRGWNGILAPARTPRPIVSRLHQEIARIVHAPELAERLAREGVAPVGNSPTEFAAVIRADIEKWAKVIKQAGIRAN